MMKKNNPVLVTQGRIPKRNPFEVSIDWLDFSIHQLSGQSEVEEILYQLGCLTGEVIDFSASRPVFNGKSWGGSGQGDAGSMIWYQPPTPNDSDLHLDSQGRYMGYEDILPPRHVVIGQDAIDYARRHLPADIELYQKQAGGAHVGDHGFRLRYRDKFNIDGQLKIALSGGVMKRCVLTEVFEWLSAFPKVVFSRIDIALDDMEKTVAISDIKATVEKGDFFDASYRCFMSSGNRGEAWGETIYLGSPASDKRLRIYDKTIESQGERDCNRWEVEFRRKKADCVGHELIEKMQQSLDDCTHYMIQVVCGVVDFRIRGKDDEKNRARCPLVPWWLDMLSRLKTSPVAIRIAKVKQTIQRGIDWIERSVAPTLAAIKGVLKEDFEAYLSKTMLEGAIKMNKVKRKLVDHTDKEQLCY